MRKFRIKRNGITTNGLHSTIMIESLFKDFISNARSGETFEVAVEESEQDDTERT